MKIENQVCTLEQAKKLKELGVSQDSYFSWCGSEENRLMENCSKGVEYGPWLFISTTKPFNNMEEDYRRDVPSAKPFAAAFTVAEIGVMLKELCYCQFLSGERNWISSDCGSFTTYPEDDCTAKTMVESMAIMLIHQLENEIIEVEDCNSRLSD